MNSGHGHVDRRKIWLKCSALLLLLTAFFSKATTGQSVRVQFVNGRSGKPIGKGGRIWVYFNNKTGRHIFDLRTDQEGEIQFEADGAETFQVSSVGYVACGEQPVGSPPRDYSIDEVLKTGLLTENDCGRLNTEPLRGRLLYFVRPATWWELFKE
jgi:hypothetical protein